MSNWKTKLGSVTESPEHQIKEFIFYLTGKHHKLKHWKELFFYFSNPKVTRFAMKEKSRIGFAFLKVWDIQMEALIEQLQESRAQEREEAVVSQYSQISLNYGNTFWEIHR